LRRYRNCGSVSSVTLRDLRHRSRPSLAQLKSIVEGRLKQGIVSPQSPYAKVCRLLNDYAAPGDNLCSEIVGAVEFLISNHEGFEDTAFELICLSWLCAALLQFDAAPRINLENLRVKSGPVASFTLSETIRADVFYRTSKAPGFPQSKWKDRSGKSLRGIPDFLLTSTVSGKTIFLIIDAKNRSRSTFSEVTYKLLGYKEAFDFTSYRAVGIFPSQSPVDEIRTLRKENCSVTCWALPLSAGKGFLSSAVKPLPRYLKRLERLFATQRQ